MKSVFTFNFLIIFFSLSAQRPDILRKKYLLDSLEDKYLYTINVKSENSFSKEKYVFFIGRAYNGFYASGSSKKINTFNSDTTRVTYHRIKLEKSQLDSLKQFEIKLVSYSSRQYNSPTQTYIISNQGKSNEYMVENGVDWNGIKELLLTLFRKQE